MSWKKPIIACGSILLAFIVLECILRLSGYIISIPQWSVHNRPFESNAYRILVLGESTSDPTWSTWPSQLENILNTRQKRVKYVVYDQGITGTNTAFIALQLQNNIERYKPQMVITMIGINDTNLFYKYDNKPQTAFIMFIDSLRLVKLFKIASSAVLYKLNYHFTLRSSKIDNQIRQAEHLKRASKFDEAILILKSVLKQNPNDEDALIRLAWIHFEKHNLAESEKIFITLLHSKLYPDDPVRGLIAVYQQKGVSKQDALKIIQKNDPSISDVLGVATDKSTRDITAYHYNLIYKVLSKNGIRLIAVQYPTLSLNSLTDYFSENDKKNIIFISNQYNFQNALTDKSYDELFIDHIRESFGHTTSYGDSLIASRVAGVLLEKNSY